MKIKSLCFLILLSVTFRTGSCYIEINAESPLGEETYTLRHSGTSANIINPGERDLFGLSDSELIRAGQAYFGARPTSAFLHDPTSWGFLYAYYNWREVQCLLSVTGVALVPISTGEMLLTAYNFTNNHPSLETDYRVRLSETTINRVSSSWEGSTSVSLEKTIRYGVRFAGGQFTTSYISTWGEGQTTEQQVTVEMVSEQVITLGPGESARLEMFVRRSTVRLDVDYMATLTGDAFINYARRHNGHHFWRAEINALMRSGRIPTTATSRESTMIGYATEGVVRVTDLRSRKVQEYPVVLKVVEHEKPGATSIVCNKH